MCFGAHLGSVVFIAADRRVTVGFEGDYHDISGKVEAQSSRIITGSGYVPLLEDGKSRWAEVGSGGIRKKPKRR